MNLTTRSIAVSLLAITSMSAGTPVFARHVSQPITIGGIVREKNATSLTISQGRKSISIIFTDQTIFVDRRGSMITKNDIRVSDRVIVRGWNPGHKQAIQASSIQDLSIFRKRARSGIAGQILIGPACPGPTFRDPGCPDQPYQGTVFVWNSDKTRKILQFTSSRDGRFRVYLPAGTYVLDPQSPPQSILPRGEEQTVIVRKGQITKVTIFYDSGIRY